MTDTLSIKPVNAKSNNFAMQGLGGSEVDTPQTQSSAQSPVLQGLPRQLQQLLASIMSKFMGSPANPQGSSAPGESVAGGLPGPAAGHGQPTGGAGHSPSPAHIKGVENWDAYRKGQDLVVTNEGKDGKGGGRSANVQGYFDNPEQKPVFINGQKQDFSGLKEDESFKHPKNVADLSMPDDANKGDLQTAQSRRKALEDGLGQNKQKLATIESNEHLAEDLKKSLSTPEKLEPNQLQFNRERLNDVQGDLKKSEDDAKALRKNIAIQETKLEDVKKEIADLEMSQKNLDELKARQDPKKPDAPKPEENKSR